MLNWLKPLLAQAGSMIQREVTSMAVPYGKRFPMEFDELFPQGAYVLGDVTAVTEYQSPEDKARNGGMRAGCRSWPSR